MGEIIAPLGKRAMISKANSRMVLIISIAAFVTVFSAVSAKTLIGQAAYQGRVISKKKVALKTLDEDLAARDTLVGSYATFVNPERNAIGGSKIGTEDRDGDNAKIVLDALPSQYDFPALITGLERLVKGQGLTISSINGIDEEVAQSANKSSSNPQPVPMAFELVVSGSYTSIQSLISSLERSIRPVQIQKVDISETEGSMRATISAVTYYQPQKDLNIKSEVVK